MPNEDKEGTVCSVLDPVIDPLEAARRKAQRLQKRKNKRETRFQQLGHDGKQEKERMSRLEHERKLEQDYTT